MSIRPEWIHELTGVCQTFIGESLDSSIEDCVTRLADLDRRLPPAKSPMESLVRQSIMVTMCMRVASADMWLLHKALLECRLVQPGAARPRTAGYEQAMAIRSIVDEHYGEPITLRALSRGLHQHRNMLARSFRRAYGIGFHEYLVGRRVERALELLVTTPYKVEAIARMVGYRSKKNFYFEFERLVGDTPASFRADHQTRDLSANRNHQVHNDT